MKRLTMLLAAALLASAAAVAAPQHATHGAGQKGAKRSAAGARQKGETRTLTGYIGDSHCGLMHMSGMGDEKSCTLACVEGGSQFVLADHAGKTVYTLDKAGQEKAREFAGREVKITGHVTGKSIHVTKIEVAS